MFAIVCGEQTSAKNRWSSSHTRVDPRGERFGDPSGQTVAWNASFCSSTSRFMSSVRMPICPPPSRSPPTLPSPAETSSRRLCATVAVAGDPPRLPHRPLPPVLLVSLIPRLLLLLAVLVLATAVLVL